MGDRVKNTQENIEQEKHKRHTVSDLIQMQSLSLEDKIIMSQRRIKNWYDYWDGDVYVSFSGGKDSTVLKHLVETTPGVYGVPNVFVNTGLEYPELQAFIKECKANGDNIDTIRPEMRFDEVIKKYGYPVASKEIAHKIYYARKGSKWAQKFIDGTAVDKDGNLSRYAVSKRWLTLLEAPFNVSAKCCDIIKKKPAKKYEKETKRKPFIGTMADESAMRKQAWQRTGCNAFESERPKSTPMAFWTEQDVLEYIKKFNLPYASIYGDIVETERILERMDGNHKELKTTGAHRTGCMFCMFGCHLEKTPNKFQRMKETHPKQWDYCINQLGLREVLEYINVPFE